MLRAREVRGRVGENSLTRVVGRPQSRCVWFTSQRPSRKNYRLVTAALAGFLLALGVSSQARAADPPAAEASAPALTAVAPAEFGVGATITVTGTGFVEGDELLLDAVVLEDVKVTATSISAKVPEKAKAGKKLHLRRAKKKLAHTETFTFVGVPKLTSASPKFAAPGEVVTFKGSKLAKVTELTLGGKKLTISEQTDKAIKATIPDGSATGPVIIKSIGGEGGLKKDYEVFYAPTLASVDPPAAFEGDAITLKGAHLAGKVKFKLGSKSLKVAADAQTDAQVTSSVPKSAKTGILKATARGKSGELTAEFTVHPTPKLTTVPKEVGAPGELKVSGKHLDAVTTWRLGQVTLTPAQAATSGKVVLTIPPDAATDLPLIAVSQSREFASKKPVSVVKLPIVHGMAFWPGAKDKTVDGVIRGKDFSDKTKFTLAGKALKTTFVSADRVEFAAVKPPKAVAALKAKAGKMTGAPVDVDGAAGGYRVGPDALATTQPGGLQNYDVFAAQLDLEASGHLLTEATAAAQASPEATKVAAIGLRIGHDLQRIGLAQAAVCGGMTVGKGKDQAAANAAAGEVLRQSQKHAVALTGGLEKLWATLTPEGLATAGLTDVDAAVASAAVAQAKVQAACKGKFHGSGTLLTDAGVTVKLELDKLYRPAIVAAFGDVLAKGKNWAAVEKDVNERLVVIADARRKTWQDALKASKGAVEASASGATTGKGAKGDKHVDPTGKPKSTGKGKGKAG